MPMFAVFLNQPVENLGAEADAAALDEHDAHAAALEASGRMVFGAPLAEASQTVSVRGGRVSAGPFSETAEVVVGFYVITAADMDDAVALASKNPINHQGGGVEVRPLTVHE